MQHFSPSRENTIHCAVALAVMQSDEPRSQPQIEIADGQYWLIIVENGQVTHYTPNVSLSHADFVKRKVGTLPAGAWVGSATKNDGYLTAINSFTFYNNQLPGPLEVQKAVHAKFR